MGQFPRKCKLRGPSGVTVGSTYISRTFRQGLIKKIRQKSGKIWAKSSENLAKKLAKFSAISDENFEH